MGDRETRYITISTRFHFSEIKMGPCHVFVRELIRLSLVYEFSKFRKFAGKEANHYDVSGGFTLQSSLFHYFFNYEVLGSIYSSWSVVTSLMTYTHA